VAWLSVFALLLPTLQLVWLPGPPPGLPTALAVRQDRVLLGTERGLYFEGGSGWQLVLTRGGVRDLAPAPLGTLIATAAGLYEWPAEASRPRALPLGAGARVNAVTVDSQGAAWVASEVGLFVRGARERAFRRETGIPAGAVHSVRALRQDVWVATRGSVWLKDQAGTFEPRLRGLDTGWWEVRGAVRISSGVVLAVPQGIWLLPDASLSARAIELGVGELRGIAQARDQLWVASERGVHVLGVEALERSASRRALDIEALGVLQASRGLLVATRRGVAVLPLTPPGGALPGLTEGGLSGPDIRTIQRAVLSYLDLSPQRMEALESRARSAAWYPQLRTTLTVDRSRSRDNDRDQTFSSGSVRSLFDRSTQAERGQGIDIQFVWDLGKLTSPDDALSVSRERRQLVELRDQVLERVNRLYFERLRLLQRLAALSPERGSERAETVLRVREIAAHLDAWTGGLFSRLDSRSPPPHGRPR
jgi:hypothetical protein